MDIENNDSEINKVVSRLSSISEILVAGYGGALLESITALSQIRSCQICTMQGNGYCDEHNITDVLTSVVKTTEDMTEQLDAVKGT